MSEKTASVDEGSKSSSTRTHRSLLEGARAHDPQAWEKMVALYAPLVHSWCRGWGLKEQDAADVFQEVFQSVASHLGNFRRERSGDTFRGWMRTIARNKVNDLFRRRQRDPEGVGGSEGRDLLMQIPETLPTFEKNEDVGESALLHRALQLIRSEFEKKTWEAFWQTAVEGRSAIDVAADLAMSPGAVRVAKSRVLQRLRSDLGELL
jgi:RNA polymerase sigma-70 factor (ECF subfamily)